jgi:hypothetical protein
MLIFRMMVLIASFAMLSSGGAEAAAKAPTADICARTAVNGGIKLAASGEREGSCCPPLSCKNVKYCPTDKEGEDKDDGCCYTKNKQGHYVCSCKKICASCK